MVLLGSRGAGGRVAEGEAVRCLVWATPTRRSWRVRDEGGGSGVQDALGIFGTRPVMNSVVVWT